MITFSRRFFVDLGARQTCDKRVDQILFDGSGDLGMRQDFGLCLGQATGLRVQAPKARRIALGRTQHSTFWRRGKRLLKERSAAMIQLRRVECDQAPDRGPLCGLVQLIAEAVQHDVAGLHFYAAPLWQRVGIRRKADTGQPRREEYISDAREVLRASEQPQVVEFGAGQAGVEASAARDDEFDLRSAQTRLVVIGLEEGVRAASRHLARCMVRRPGMPTGIPR